MIGKPNDISRKCPKCETWGTFRVIYARSKNRYVNIGRKCIDTPYNREARWTRPDTNEGCGHFEKAKE